MFAAGQILTAADLEAEINAVEDTIPYAAVMGGTGWSIGDGTIVGNYKMLGATLLWFWVRVTMGSTSTYGAGNGPSITMPEAALSQSYMKSFHGWLIDADGSEYPCAATANSFQTFSPLCFTAGGAYVAGAALSSTVPFTWANTDQIIVTGTYDADL